MTETYIAKKECLDGIQKHTFHIISRPLLISGPLNSSCSSIPGPINDFTKIEPFQDQFSGNFTMAGTNNILQWETPKVSLSVANQAEEWKTYVWVLDHLETLDIDTEAPSQVKKGWNRSKLHSQLKTGRYYKYSLTMAPSYHRSNRHLAQPQ